MRRVDEICDKHMSALFVFCTVADAQALRVDNGRCSD